MRSKENEHKGLRNQGYVDKFYLSKLQYVDYNTSRQKCKLQMEKVEKPVLQ